MRDCVAWYDAYADPSSSLSWRLERVRSYLRDALDERPGRVSLVSACSGDGRDVLGCSRSFGDQLRFVVE